MAASSSGAQSQFELARREQAAKAVGRLKAVVPGSCVRCYQRPPEGEALLCDPSLREGWRSTSTSREEESGLDPVAELFPEGLH
jgi:hypothetical protein